MTSSSPSQGVASRADEWCNVPADKVPELIVGHRHNAPFLKRTVLGTVANLLTQVVNSASQLILVPIFLIAWGNQTYGEWLTLSAAVAYLWMLDFGVQTYVVNRLKQCYLRGAVDEYKRIL